MKEMKQYFKRTSANTVKKLNYIKSLSQSQSQQNREKVILEIARLFYYDSEIQIKAIYFLHNFNENKLRFSLKKIRVCKKSSEGYIKLSKRIYIHKDDYEKHKEFIEYMLNSRYSIGNVIRCFNEIVENLMKYGRVKKENYYKYGYLASIVRKYILLEADENGNGVF